MKMLVEIELSDITPENLSKILSALKSTESAPKKRKERAPKEETPETEETETEEETEEETPPKKKKSGKKTKKRKTTEITEDDVRKALTAYKNEYGGAAAREKIQAFGVSKVKDLDADDYPALLAELV